MRLKNLLLTLAVLTGMASGLDAQTEKSKRPRVAILEFKAAKESWSGWGWYWNVESQARMSSVLQDLFVTELSEVGTGKIRLIERERLQEIRQEQAFGQSGEVDTATAVKLGKLLGVRYMITGKITRFASQKSGVSTGWGAANLIGRLTHDSTAGAIAGSVDVRKTSFDGRLDARVIDVETGEIVGATSAEHKESNVGVKVAGTGNEFQYDQTLVNKVFEPCVKEMAPKLLQKILADQ
jgi:curli biogenesis system outer membrane secretion channel CsgG